MIQLKHGNEIDREKWNELALHPLQSFEWGEAREKLGTEILRFQEFDDNNNLIHVYQMSLHPIIKGYKIGYLPKSDIPTAEFSAYLQDYGKKNNIVFFKSEPDILKGEKNMNDGFIQSNESLFPDWTQTVDLTVLEEELLKNMKPKTRYNVRLAQKKGVEIKEMTTDEGFEIFIKLYFDTCKRQNYHGHNYEYHKTIFDTLKKNIAHILIAFYDGIPVVAYELFLYKNKLYYPYGGSSELHRNVMAANLIMWEAILFGKKNNAAVFDMWGSAPPNYTDDDPFAGFTRLKEGYGSTFVQFVGSYDLVINKQLYHLYKTVYKARKIWLKFR